MILSEETSKNVKVVLTGDGSDEIFGGYPWYLFDRLCRPFSILPLPLRRMMLLGPLMPRLKPWASQVFLAPRPIALERYACLIGVFNRKILDQLFSKDLRQPIRDEDDPFPASGILGQLRGLHPFSSLQYIEINTRLTDFGLHGLDRVAMAHSLEARVPFLDHELVELCAHVPPGLKLRGLKEKYILRKAMEGRLPPEILKKKKHAFTAPSWIWLRGKLPEFAVEMLSKKQLRDKGYFNPEYVADLLAKHRTGKANYTRPLMAILGIQIWDKIFMHGCQPSPGVEQEAF
jgi:asparagine synthase (glutamine-hydrolysing)